MPSRSRNCFCVWRSWIVRSTLAPGPHRRVTLELVEQLGRHVLGVERDHVDLLREVTRRFAIVERADDDAVGDLRGRAARARIEHDDAIAHAARRERHHAAELAAAEHADGPARQRRQRLTVIPACLRARAASATRDTRRALRASAGSPSARIAHASSAALTAPASPIASVPTGMPFGICTIDSSESTPVQRASTKPARRAPAARVFAAVMPGRCAAPPAPAMMTCSPRSAAPRVGEQQIRRAMRRDDLLLVRHAELVEQVGRVLHRGPVAARAHDDADARRRRAVEPRRL